MQTANRNTFRICINNKIYRCEGGAGTRGATEPRQNATISECRTTRRNGMSVWQIVRPLDWPWPASRPLHPIFKLTICKFTIICKSWMKKLWLLLLLQFFLSLSRRDKHQKPKWKKSAAHSPRFPIKNNSCACFKSDIMLIEICKFYLKNIRFFGWRFEDLWNSSVDVKYFFLLLFFSFLFLFFGSAIYGNLRWKKTSF